MNFPSTDVVRLVRAFGVRLLALAALVGVTGDGAIAAAFALPGLALLCLPVQAWRPPAPGAGPPGPSSPDG